MLRVLIVEDSPTVRLLLKSILESEEDMTVVGTARNGEEGLQKTLSLKPDIVTMDIFMPGMDGFEATRRIMEEAPRPIVIVTSSINDNEVKLSFQELKAGALALVNKPSGPGTPQFVIDAEKLTNTVRLMAEVKVVSQLRRSRPKNNINLPIIKTEGVYKIAAIGASTGGPAAISTILKNIPHELPVPILIVQHISAGFDRGFSEWLGSTTGHKVIMAEDNQELYNGTIYVAPIGKHMGVTNGGKITLDAQLRYKSSFCPSANYLFKSVSQVYGKQAIGIILTGMGNDGTQGLIDMHKAGGYVIAQDKATSVVYGMPNAAVEANVVNQILPIDHIASAISLLLGIEGKNGK